jgi:hypothetical protein
MTLSTSSRPLSLPRDVRAVSYRAAGQTPASRWHPVFLTACVNRLFSYVGRRAARVGPKGRKIGNKVNDLETTPGGKPAAIAAKRLTIA